MRSFKNPRFAVSVMVILFAVSFSKCRIQTGTSRSTYKAKKLPPRQAKKTYGEKSAKRYAPGHNKNFLTKRPVHDLNRSFCMW